MKKKLTLLLLFACGMVGGGTVFADLAQMVEQHFLLTQSKAPQTINSTIHTNSSQHLDIFEAFIQAEVFAQQDVPALLESTERTNNLEEYLQAWEEVLWVLNTHASRITTELAQVSVQLSSCESALLQANSQYTLALNTNSEFDFLNAVDRAKEARSCIGEQYVTHASLQGLQAKLSRYQSALTKRISYLRSNQSLIIEHYEVLKPQLISQLAPLANTLETTR